MILPSQLLPPTTEETGYFGCPAQELADWIVHRLGREWTRGSMEAASLLEAVTWARPVAPGTPERRYLLVPLEGWTAVVNDGPFGTDLGLMPTRAAEELECLAVRAVAGLSSERDFEGTILEVYDPAVKDNPFRCRRSIYAADDGGTWRFGESGQAFTFEDVDAYRGRQIRARFTPQMLERYLLELGIPVDREPETVTAVLVERRSS